MGENWFRRGARILIFGESEKWDFGDVPDFEEKVQHEVFLAGKKKKPHWECNFQMLPVKREDEIFGKGNLRVRWQEAGALGKRILILARWDIGHGDVYSWSECW